VCLITIHKIDFSGVRLRIAKLLKYPYIYKLKLLIHLLPVALVCWNTLGSKQNGTTFTVVLYELGGWKYRRGESLERKTKKLRRKKGRRKE
jgi:hypothetical protein